MAATFSRAEIFATNLSSAMQKKNLSRRGLAKLISPDDPENGRRLVRRALQAKHTPNRQTVRKYADALEVTPEDLLPSDEDEQEAAPDMDVALRLRALEVSMADAQDLYEHLKALA